MQAEANVIKPKGLGGWLIWPTIIVVLSPLSLLSSVIGIFQDCQNPVPFLQGNGIFVGLHFLAVIA
ncbi:hypothetical protein P4V43_17025 [Brevibacillus fortis]|uniref:hypothetical protein n=1 Tax=Brevibacillus fortis TaxID=2126352 RepID=UPI002E1FC550|nr:hypothetical protein [Brevibacillus fortis]